MLLQADSQAVAAAIHQVVLVALRLTRLVVEVAVHRLTRLVVEAVAVGPVLAALTLCLRCRR
jgi:hypothetical protein